MTINYPHELDTEQAHCAAIHALIVELGWTAENGYGPWVWGSTETGIVAVCDTKHGGNKLT